MMDQTLFAQHQFDMEKGFTLIELLIVIGIIGILAAMAMFGIANAFPRARDTKRKSDLKQIQILVEREANQNNDLYPAVYGDVCTATNCPTDPIDDPATGAVPYDYLVNATQTEYALMAQMEIETPPCGVGMNCFWMICSNGKADYTSLFPALPYSGCPLP